MGKCPGEAKFEGYLPNGQVGIQIFFEPWEGSFNSIVQHYQVGSWKKETKEEDQDDEVCICIVTLESRFENKETVLNW